MIRDVVPGEEFLDGKAARYLDQSRWTNPHAISARGRELWAAGWDEADRRIKGILKDPVASTAPGILFCQTEPCCRPVHSD